MSRVLNRLKRKEEFQLGAFLQKVGDIEKGKYTLNDLAEMSSKHMNRVITPSNVKYALEMADIELPVRARSSGFITKNTALMLGKCIEKLFLRFEEPVPEELTEWLKNPMR